MLRLWLFVLIVAVSGDLLPGTPFSAAINRTSLDYEGQVLRDLLDGYRRTIRPGVLREGAKEPTKVSVTFSIFRILGSDDTMESLSAILYVTLSWRDQRLLWSPSQYGNLTMISFDAREIWTPQLFILNMGTLNPDDTTYKSKVLVELRNRPDQQLDNLLTINLYSSIQERCPFDMTYFPFDHQECIFCGFGAEFPFEVHYESSDPTVELFQPGGQWDLVNVSNHLQSNVHNACFRITVQRRWVYYVINLFLPTIIICVLNTIGLFVSVETASEEMEFTSLGQTTLLSLGVLMLTVASETPKGANVISLLGGFFLAMICQTLLASLTAVLLKKWKRAMAKCVVVPRSAVSTTRPAVVKHHHGFLMKHASKLCMAMHLLVIAIVMVTVFAMGCSNIRPHLNVNFTGRELYSKV